MACYKKIFEWVRVREAKIIPVLFATVIAIDIYLIAAHFWPWLLTDAEDNLIWCDVSAVVATVMYVGMLCSLKKSAKLEETLSNIYHEFGMVYFHGFKLQRYIDSDAMLRFQEWLGVGICKELAAVAMIILRDNKSARLCHGDWYENNLFVTKHAWVEFKIPLNGWFVMDLAWMCPGICKRRAYFRNLRSEGKMVRRWTCSYNEFWQIKFVEVVSEMMRNRKTSHVLLDLSAFGKPDGHGFSEWCYQQDEPKFSNGSILAPHSRIGSDKLVSSWVIRDFVKNPKRKQPKARSVRLTRSLKRKYERWLAEQIKQKAA